jgi:hypothetical protein
LRELNLVPSILILKSPTTRKFSLPLPLSHTPPLLLAVHLKIIGRSAGFKRGPDINKRYCTPGVSSVIKFIYSKFEVHIWAASL